MRYISGPGEAACDRGRNEDISNRVRELETALEEKDRRFWQLVDKFPMALVFYDESGRILRLSRMFTRTFGYTLADIPDVRRWWPKAYPDPGYRREVQEKWHAQMESVEEGKLPEPFEAVITARDGTPHVTQVYNICIGGMKMIVFIDITRAKRTEEIMKNILQGVASETGQKFFASIAISLARSLHADYTLIGELADGEQEVIRTLAVCRNGNIADNFTYSLKATPCENVIDRKLCVYTSGITRLFPGDPLLKQLGVEGYVGVPLLDSKNRPIGIMVALYREPVPDPELAESVLRIFSYRTVAEIERGRTERALINARSEAELYIDLMSHDITNMNQASLGFLELACYKLESEGSLKKEDASLLASAMKPVLSSSMLIDNVKKLQRARKGGYPEEIIDIPCLLEQVRKEHVAVPGRHVTINLSITAGCRVKANMLLKDVYAHVVENAIKHSAGDLTINIIQDAISRDGSKFCRVAVEDTGPGIEDGRKRSIFERMGWTHGSKGIGLYLVKTIVEGFHGSIWVEDRVPGDYSQGSRFVILVPANGDRADTDAALASLPHG